MRFGLWSLLVMVPGLTLAAHLASNDPREQTAFLERLATGIERAKVVPPETERAIKAAIQSIRRNAPRLDETLDLRQKRAIALIESKLSNASVAVSVRYKIGPSADDHTASIGHE